MEIRFTIKQSLTRLKVKSAQIGLFLKSPNLIIPKTTAPKYLVEYHHKSIGTIRCSLALSYDSLQHCQKIETHVLDKLTN